LAHTVALDVKISGLEQEVAAQLIESAHQIYLYSKASSGNIAVNLKA